ncbi:iron-sulfur cluster repair di-iron protein [uncultured Bacteroides sp.]|uniref:iron-sulfur cluster repair di-iron protein n=1 Tax=uncultured Bacteroides sp. TaxID=162156 RepID=UPI002AA82075|nr:iron-sulfur cluster repair di-iron protein [uncultured Bacteroides sp.]
MKDLRSMKVGDIVTEDFRAAEIFKREGIDFCCGGNQSLEQVAKEKNLNIAEIEYKLNNLDEVVSNRQLNYNDWNLDFLCDYIVNEYHNKVYKLLPQLMAYLNKLVQVHGANHPELKEIADLFSLVNTELPIHQRQEEEVFFPAIKEALRTNSVQAKEIITSQIAPMMDEHELIGGTIDKINVLSKRYSVPDDGCNTYRLTYKLLEEFEDDLHTHVHLENNILYPKALNLTK